MFLENSGDIFARGEKSVIAAIPLRSYLGCVARGCPPAFTQSQEGTMAKHKGKTETSTEMQAETKTVGDAAAFKYAQRDDRRKKAAAECSPGWNLTNVVLVLGKHRPTRENSVKGKIYAMVAAAGKDGITGAELVAKMREVPNTFEDNPSKYSKNGVPVVPWCEDYILGMTRPRFGFLEHAKKQPKHEPVDEKHEPVAEKKAA